MSYNASMPSLCGTVISIRFLSASFPSSPELSEDVDALADSAVESALDDEASGLSSAAGVSVTS